MSLMLNVRKLADFIEQIPNFITNLPMPITYNHMGAVITDSILQAGLNYNNIVKPRVEILINNYPIAKTTDGFIKLINNYDFCKIINWNHSEKIDRIKNLSYFFVDNLINNEKTLQEWIIDTKNCKKLQLLHGIGPKTVDYLKNLIGISTIAVDRHVRNFVNDAGLNLKSYDEIKTVVEYTADILNISRSSLDKLIWNYMSSSKQLELSFK